MQTMNPLSRRQFLQLTGITLLSSQLLDADHLLRAFAAPEQPLWGRALSTLTVYQRPNEQSHIMTRLWADDLVSLRNAHGNWYRVETGYVRRSAVQPITDFYNAHNAPKNGVFWAQVTGSVAAVRRWCAADAPLVARIGHGGVARVIDSLTDQRGEAGSLVWYGIEGSDGSLLGWTQSPVWQAVAGGQTDSLVTHLHINLREQQLTAFAGDNTLLSAPVSTGSSLTTGHYEIVARQPAQHMPDQAGIPWIIRTDSDLAIMGAYWHNQFGKPLADAHDARVQVTPPLARWLYRHTAANAEIAVSH